MESGGGPTEWRNECYQQYIWLILCCEWLLLWSIFRALSSTHRNTFGMCNGWPAGRIICVISVRFGQIVCDFHNNSGGLAINILRWTQWSLWAMGIAQSQDVRYVCLVRPTSYECHLSKRIYLDREHFYPPNGNENQMQSAILDTSLWSNQFCDFPSAARDDCGKFFLSHLFFFAQIAHSHAIWITQSRVSRAWISIHTRLFRFPRTSSPVLFLFILSFRCQMYFALVKQFYTLKLVSFIFRWSFIGPALTRTFNANAIFDCASKLHYQQTYAFVSSI